MFKRALTEQSAQGLDVTDKSTLLEAPDSRTETDFMGPREIPAAAYWGIQTLRAVENFPITGATISAYPQLVRALAQVKHAAVLANFDLGLIDATKRRPLCGPAGTSKRAVCTASLWSMSSRAEPEPQPT